MKPRRTADRGHEAGRAHTADTPAHPPRRQRLFGIWLAVLYLGALSLLILWEFHERFDEFSSECTFRDEARSSFYSRPYSRFLAWASPATTGHVATVVIPGDLEEIQSNVCLGREYLADVLRVLDRQNPAVVVIDKFFSPNSCSRAPQSTSALVGAVRAMQSPVVIGATTDGLPEMEENTCLVGKEQLDFGAPNVTHGLIRLNAELERTPLQWKVLSPWKAEHGDAAHPSPAPDEAVHRTGDEHRVEEKGGTEIMQSLALAAVKAYDPEFVRQRGVQRLIDQDDHAYSRLDLPVPRVTTTQVLCASDDTAVRKRWGLACGHEGLPTRLLGKVVVIGAEQRSDLKQVLGRPMWGVRLQAIYMESILSGDYLRTLPVAVSFGLFAAFVFLIEGLPTILLVYRPHWKRKFLLRYAYPRRRYIWVVFWAVSIVAVSAVLSLALRFLPPLLVYGDILLIAITRLLYFSAESAEHPLMHAHSHGEEEHA